MIGAAIWLCVAFGADIGKGDSLDVKSENRFVTEEGAATPARSHRPRGEPKANGPLYDNPAYGYRWPLAAFHSGGGWVPPDTVSAYDNPGYGPHASEPSRHSGLRPPFNQLAYDNPGYGPHPTRRRSPGWGPPVGGPLYDNPAYGYRAAFGATE